MPATLRFRIQVSSDKDLMFKIRKNVGIWNINSFAEFYMQIYGKYEKNYVLSCYKFRKERQIFERSLKQISYLRVAPSLANYFLCEAIDKYTSYELALKLLTDCNILIKDCSSKKGFPKEKHYIRIAIRDRKDNNAIAETFKTL